MEPTNKKANAPNKSGGLSHAFWMVVCCLVPLALIAVLAYSGFSLKGFGILAILLLCPLLHFFMMRRGRHEHGSSENG